MAFLVFLVGLACVAAICVKADIIVLSIVRAYYSKEHIADWIHFVSSVDKSNE